MPLHSFGMVIHFSVKNLFSVKIKNKRTKPDTSLVDCYYPLLLLLLHRNCNIFLPNNEKYLILTINEESCLFFFCLIFFLPDKMCNKCVFFCLMKCEFFFSPDKMWNVFFFFFRLTKCEECVCFLPDIMWFFSPDKMWIVFFFSTTNEMWIVFISVGNMKQ